MEHRVPPRAQPIIQHRSLKECSGRTARMEKFSMMWGDSGGDAGPLGHLTAPPEGPNGECLTFLAGIMHRADGSGGCFGIFG
jgi:hypothetical protein